MEEKIFGFVAKTEKLNYALVIILWVIGFIVAIVGFPWIVLGILAMHVPETLFIGIRVGKRNGETLANSIAKCMSYGFLWWMPVVYHEKYE